MVQLHNIYITGAAKSGTTALYYLLKQHPAICTPVVKEPNYFNNLDNTNDIVKPGCGPGDSGTIWTGTRQDYYALFPLKKKHRYRLDASVSYLYSYTAAQQIARYDPDASIIIVLRNPVERAWSHYRHLVRDGRESLSFEEALDQEKERINRGWEFSWHLKNMGQYHDQVKRYFHYFDKSRICLFLFEDLKKDMGNLIEAVTTTAGLTPFDYQLEQEQQNVSGVSRIPWMSRLINHLLRYKSTINKVVPPSVTHSLMQTYRSLNTKTGVLKLNDETRQELKEYFSSDIHETSCLIGRDLSSWLN